ncbi:MAG: hypothetical protein K9H61_02270 [Bacteroidia bacterium]|nr:hypothetical protein [Bacteroidia bacterium]MCF8427151.1 hypothetical protein [Bacteroidia bacterium]MCF8445796.1 hypothetical protein [Bacteroidia bacterium]
MTRKSNHWRTNVIGIIAIALFIAAMVAVFVGYTTLTEAGTFLSLIAMPLLMIGFRLSADSKAIDQNKYNP